MRGDGQPNDPGWSGVQQVGALVQQLRSSAQAKGRDRWDTASIAMVWDALDDAIIEAGTGPTETGDTC
jgi:hypothetical protein